MLLNGKQREILRAGIIGAYPSKDEFQILVAEKMEVNLEEIAKGKSYREQVFYVIQDFEARGIIQDFIQVIVQEKPKSPYLKSIRAEFFPIINYPKSETREAKDVLFEDHKYGGKLVMPEKSVSSDSYETNAKISKALQCLCYEDETADYSRIQTYIKLAWSSMATNDAFKKFNEINITRFSQPEEAVQEIINNLNKYHLMVVDLLFRNPDESFSNVGINMIQIARNQKINLGIIGISSSDQGRIYDHLREDFGNAAKTPEPGHYGTSGRYYIPKRSLLETGHTSVNDLARIMANVLIDSGVVDPAPRTFLPTLEYASTSSSDPQYYPLMDIVERVGEKNLQELIGHFMDETSSDCTVYYIAPGWSGAFVVRLVGGGKELLLKLSKSKDSIQRELERYPKIGSALRDDFVSYQSDKIAESSNKEWYAIAANFNTDAVTLTERIRTSINPQEIEDLMYEVFSNGLQQAYNLTTSPPEPISVFSSLSPSTSRIARIHLAIQSLDFLARKYSREGEIFKREVLENYLNYTRVGKVEEKDIRTSAVYCLSHGDLHGKNILVSKRGYKVKLIDPANCSPQHWASDLARFCIDQIMSLWDDLPYFDENNFDATNAHEWQNFTQWRNLVHAFVTWQPLDRFIPQPPTSPNLGVIAVLQWCHKNLKTLHGDLVGDIPPGWQFQLALAVELMRSASLEDLPTPKRVLGLVCAYDTLRICERSLT